MQYMIFLVICIAEIFVICVYKDLYMSCIIQNKVRVDYDN